MGKLCLAIYFVFVYIRPSTFIFNSEVAKNEMPSIQLQDFKTFPRYYQFYLAHQGNFWEISHIFLLIIEYSLQVTNRIQLYLDCPVAS